MIGTTMPKTQTGRTVAVLLALVVALAATATSGSGSPATFPGPAGKIALGSGALDQSRGLVLANPDGSGKTAIPTAPGVAPVWSADGKWLAYSTFPEPWVIRVARADGSSDRELLPKTAGAPAVHYTFAWSPTGSEIAYQCATGLCAVRVSDGVTRRILDKVGFFDLGSYPSWSPDGKKIAFHCISLCIVNADGSDAVAYTPPAGTPLGRFPDWSPDGRQLLVTFRGKVQTLDVDDGELRTLVDLGGELIAHAHWSPDGKSVLVSQSGSGVYILRLDGNQPVQVPNGVFGDWGTSPAVMVSDARFEPRWVLSRQAGSLVVSGIASHASNLTVTIRSVRATYPARSASVSTGAYTATVPLPLDLVPGSYEIVVGGTSGGEKLLDTTRAAALATPPTGLVSSSTLTASAGGRRLTARFVFSVRPASGRRPTAVWLSPSGAVALRERLPNARTVSSALAGLEPLARGRWRCRLEIGGVVLAIPSARVG